MSEPITPEYVEKLRVKYNRTASKFLDVLEGSSLAMLRAEQLQDALADMIDARIELTLAQRELDKDEPSSAAVTAAA